MRHFEMDELRKMRDDEAPPARQRRNFHFLPGKHKLSLINVEQNSDRACVFVVSAEEHDHTYRFSPPHPAFCEDAVDEAYIRRVLDEISALGTLYYEEKARSEGKSFGAHHWLLFPIAVVCLAGFVAQIARLYLPGDALKGARVAGAFCAPWRCLSSGVLHRARLAVHQRPEEALPLLRHQSEPLREDRRGVQPRAAALEQQVPLAARLPGALGRAPEVLPHGLIT